MGNLRADQSNLICDLAELPDHGCRHLVHGLHAAELVGVGKEVALERRRVRRQVGDERGIGLRHFQEVIRGAEPCGFDGASDVEHGEAFRNDDSTEINVAAAQTLLQVDDVRRLLEEIFPGLERTVAMEVVPENECLLAANHSGGLELGGDAAGGISRAQHHEGFPREVQPGVSSSPGEPTGEREHRDEDEPENLTHDGDSLDDRGRPA